MAVPNLKMNNDREIPQIALGLWKVKNKNECRESVEAALELGYTHFDTAQIYGNESYLGEALQEAGVDRSKLFITTKIWNGNQKEKKLQPSFEESLENLQTDYVDLLLLHFPVSKTRRAAWPLMEEIYKSGKAKSIGVSNYTIRHLEELLKECKIKPAVNQVELHVFLQQPELLDFCKQNDIVVEAYSPLAHGHGMDDPVLQKIAQKYDKTSAQIMLRWCVEKELVILPKSVHADRIKQNFEVFDFSLDAEDMQELKNLDKDYRTCWDPTDVQ